MPAAEGAVVVAVAVDAGGRRGSGGGGGVPRGSSIDWAPLFTPTALPVTPPPLYHCTSIPRDHFKESYRKGLTLAIATSKLYSQAPLRVST
ncbi:hypothetical protein ACI65C_008199, partial [Semiaphis heraclei]